MEAREREAHIHMKIAGIIAEYNPFHSGHAHHIRETRRLSGCDFVVVCMAGSYTQRGEAACMDKWSRARAALLCGADAVFELPALWAVRSADAFARGGVAILAGLGCDCLSFGSETAELPLLRALAGLRESEPESLATAVRDALAQGKSHARARGEALAAHLSLSPELLSAPNLILGAEYIRAADALGADMEFLPVPRAGSYHSDALDGKIPTANRETDSLPGSAPSAHAAIRRQGDAADTETRVPGQETYRICGDATGTEAACPARRSDGFPGGPSDANAAHRTSEGTDPECSPLRPESAPGNAAVFASASAIRAALEAGRREEALSCVPPAARALLADAPGMHAPDDLLLHALRRMTCAQLANLPDVREGLGDRVARFARTAASRAELIEGVKCKRYTYARISRLCAHALLEIDRELCDRHPLPEYARLIGMRADARPLLSELKRRAALPIISDAAKLVDDEVFQLECRATDLRALQCDAPTDRRAGQDFTRKFVRIEE